MKTVRLYKRGIGSNLLTPEEQEWISKWCADVHVVETTEQALRIVTAQYAHRGVVYVDE